MRGRGEGKRMRGRGWIFLWGEGDFLWNKKWRALNWDSKLKGNGFLECVVLTGVIVLPTIKTVFYGIKHCFGGRAMRSAAIHMEQEVVGLLSY